jgi:hypothetical protein
MAFPVEEKYIRLVEEKLGITFPQAYRNKLMRENGGELPSEEHEYWTFLPVLDSSNEKRIARTYNDIYRETQEVQKWENFPQNGIMIAENGTGDALIFLKDSSQPGGLDPHIYYWSHEGGYDEITVWAENDSLFDNFETLGLRDEDDCNED